MSNDGAWKPMRGQVALIEFPDDADHRLTGIVMGDEAGPVVIDLGNAAPPAPERCEVRASFFAPDALYRVKGMASRRPETAAVIDLAVHEVDRVQRRAAPRARLTLPVVLSAFDGPGEFASVIGETVDIGPGGCRVRTPKPWSGGADPTVSLQLPDGTSFVARAQMLQGQEVAGHHEYRLSFRALDDDELEHLAEIVMEIAATS